MKEELIKTVVGELFETTKGSEVARDVMRNLLSPASAELGEWFAEKLRLLRYSSSLKKGLEKVRKMHADAGVPVSPVPLKKLLPLLEGLALEETGDGKDETLHDMWAALLANASASHDSVRPMFLSALRSLSGNAAKVLCRMLLLTQQDIFPAEVERLDFVVVRRNRSLRYFFGDGLDVSDLATCLDELMAMRLIEGYSYTPTTRHRYGYALTDFGLSFLEACQPLKKSKTL